MESKEILIWKKRIGICLVAGVFLLIATGYWGVYRTYRKSQEKHPYVFGATYMTMNNQFYKVVNNQLQMQIEKNGDHLIALDPALDQKKQNEQMKYLVEQKVDAIFLNPVDWKEIKPGLKAAKKAGIPVIVIDSQVYDEDLVHMTIASDNYKAGVQCAKDMMKKRKSGNIVLLTHQKAKSGVERIQGFLDTIKNHKEYKIIASADTEGQIERALPKVNKIIEKYPDIDVIMALNDPAAMGALAALDSNHYGKDVLVYGVDGSPEGKKLIQEGMMTGTSAQSPKKIGDIAIESAYKILQGKKVSKKKVVSVKMITKKNIGQSDVSRWQ